MDRLYLLLRKSQRNDKKALLCILEQFEPKIRKSLCQTSKNNREDLYQELKLRVIKLINNYDLNSCPGLCEYISSKTAD